VVLERADVLLVQVTGHLHHSARGLLLRLVVEREVQSLLAGLRGMAEAAAHAEPSRERVHRRAQVLARDVLGEHLQIGVLLLLLGDGAVECGQHAGNQDTRGEGAIGRHADRALHPSSLGVENGRAQVQPRLNSPSSSDDGNAIEKPVNVPACASSRGCPGEAAPRRARERAADADAPHAECRHVGDGGERGADQHVHGLGRHGADNGGDLLARADAGRVQAVGAGLGVGGEPAHGLRQVGPAGDEALRARDQRHAAARDRGHRRAHALDGEVEFEQRGGGVAGRVLDRETGDPGRDRAAHVRRDVGGLHREAVLEVGVHRHVDARGQLLRWWSTSSSERSLSVRPL
jgi:hypothetical protein